MAPARFRDQERFKPYGSANSLSSTFPSSSAVISRAARVTQAPRREILSSVMRAVGPDMQIAANTCPHSSKIGAAIHLTPGPINARVVSVYDSDSGEGGRIPSSTSLRPARLAG